MVPLETEICVYLALRRPTVAMHVSWRTPENTPPRFATHVMDRNVPRLVNDERRLEKYLPAVKLVGTSADITPSLSRELIAVPRKSP